MDTHAFVCICIHAHTQTQMRMHMHIHYRNTHMYTYIHNHAYISTQTRTHIYTHMYIYTCTHMLTQGPTYKSTGIPIQGHLQRHTCAHTCTCPCRGMHACRDTHVHTVINVYTTGTHSGTHTFVVISRAALLGSAGGHSPLCVLLTRRTRLETQLEHQLLCCIVCPVPWRREAQRGARCCCIIDGNTDNSALSQL